MMSLPVRAGSLFGEFADRAGEIGYVFKSAVPNAHQDTTGGFPEHCSYFYDMI